MILIPRYEGPLGLTIRLLCSGDVLEQNRLCGLQDFQSLLFVQMRHMFHAYQAQEGTRAQYYCCARGRPYIGYKLFVQQNSQTER